MAGAPEWKVYRAGEYVAAFKHADDAALFVAAVGGHVRHGHSAKFTVWREGEEAFSAGESYDRATKEMHRRVDERWAATEARAHG